MGGLALVCALGAMSPGPSLAFVFYETQSVVEDNVGLQLP